MMFRELFIIRLLLYGFDNQLLSKMIRIQLFIFLCIGGLAQLHAQTDSTVVLPELEILDDKLIKHIKGDKLEKVDTLQIINNPSSTLAEILTAHAGINIRSYGLSGLATPSFRGTGSSHSALLWDGYNLQSMMNGSADLNLLPITFVDDITLQYGGSSSLNGSGTMGGTINVNSDRPRFGNRPLHIRLTGQTGSFGARYLGLNTGFSNDRVYTKIRIFKQVANNDFPYFNRFTQTNESMINAGTEKWGLMAESAYCIRPTQILSIKYWYQDNAVEIPSPISASADSMAIQKDDFHRATIKYEWAREKSFLSLKSGGFWHSLIYDDGFDRPSINESFTSISELVYETAILPFWKIESGVNFTVARAETINYGSKKPTRNTTAFSLTNSLEPIQQLSVGISVGEVLDGGQPTPISYSLNTLFEWSPAVKLRGKWAKSFRLPTFNDLYWRGSSHGNPDLLPENGYSLDLGAVIYTNTNLISHQADITFFYNNISDWIQWRPISASGWTPTNIDEIWSYGLEYRGHFSYVFANTQNLLLNYSYNYLKATKERPEGAIPISLDAPMLTYTPEHQMNATLSYVSNKYTFSYGHRFTSKQYTDDSNSERFALDEYQVGDVSVKYQLQFGKKHVLDLIAQVNNVWDTAYENRAAYPMPGRNYKLTITYQIN